MNNHRLIEITDEVRAEVSSPELDLKDMEYCVLSSQTELREIVASNPKLPLRFSDWMKKDIEPSVRASLAQNSSIETEIINDLSFDKNISVVSGAAANSNLGASRLLELARHRSYLVRTEIARNPSVTIEVLKELSVDTEWGVRRCVASNVNSPNEILNKLAGEEIQEILLAVASNPATSMDTLKGLWLSPQDVRRSVAENPNCTEEFLLAALDEALKPNGDQDETWDDDIKGDTNIREAIAQRANLSRSLIEKLLVDPSHYVRRYLASNTSLIDSDLSVLALDADEDVRLAVVENPKSTSESKVAATLLGLPERDSSDE